MDVMLKCLGAFTRRCARDKFVFCRSDHTNCLGVILSGKVRKVR